LRLSFALVIARGLPEVDLFAREVLGGGERLGAWAADRDLHGVAHERLGEVDVLEALGRDRQVAHGDIPLAFEQAGDHLASIHGDAHHGKAHVSGLELLVEIRLQEPRHVVGEAALDRAIDEIVGLRVRDEDPNYSPLDHPVEIADPLFARKSEPGFPRRARRGRLSGRLSRRGRRDQRQSGKQREDSDPHTAHLPCRDDCKTGLGRRR
jgi:hypothetical protein